MKNVKAEIEGLRKDISELSVKMDKLTDIVVTMGKAENEKDRLIQEQLQGQINISNMYFSLLSSKLDQLLVRR